MNTIKKLFPILMVAALLAGTIAASPRSVAAVETIPGCERWHVVQKGEVLSTIAAQYNTTFPILTEINGLEDPNILYAEQRLCVAVDEEADMTPILPNTGSGIRIYATSVKEDETVTLQGKYLAPNTVYTITLSNMKGNHREEYTLGTATTGSDGSFSRTYNLPDQLDDVSVIKVLATSTKGDTVSNWFYNMTTDEHPGGFAEPALYFTILSVEKGKKVTIQVNNMLPRVNYQVYMGKKDSLGVGGINVGVVKSAKGGTMIATFNIPDALEKRAMIDLRVENNSLVTFAYLTFENQ